MPAAGGAPQPEPIARPPRRIGRYLGIAGAALVVVGLAGAFVLRGDQILTALFPPPLPTATVSAAPTIAPLEGEARTRYLAGRRYLRMDDAEAYAKAEAAFRAALEGAPNNPKATAGILEALSLARASGAGLSEDVLNTALGAASGAFKDDPRGVETNRALGRYYATVGRADQAIGYVEIALTTRPDDTESLLLRSEIRAQDPAQAEGAAADLAAAAADGTLTRAHRLRAENAAAGTPERAAADAALAALVAANAEARAALEAGSYAFDEAEAARLLPPDTTTIVAVTPAPSPEATAVADASPVPTATEAAVPTATTVASPAATATSAVVAATPAPTATPRVIATATPAPTAVTRTTPVRATPAPTATTLAAMTTPAATPTPDFQIATAGAEDHYIAGSALLSAGSVDDAITEFGAAVKAAPKNAKYKLGLAAALARGGQRQKAAETLVAVIEAEPRNAEAHKMLGLLFESTGQRMQACSSLTEYVRLAPQARDVADIRTRLVRNGCGG